MGPSGSGVGGVQFDLSGTGGGGGGLRCTSDSFHGDAEGARPVFKRSLSMAELAAAELVREEEVAGMRQEAVSPTQLSASLPSHGGTAAWGAQQRQAQQLQQLQQQAQQARQGQQQAAAPQVPPEAEQSSLP